MKSEDSDTATGTSDEPAPQQTGAVEQKSSTTTSFEDQLLKLAQEEGHIASGAVEVQPKTEPSPAQDEPEEEQDETGTPETPAEGEDPEEEEPKPAAKGEPWPESAKARVAEETDKRRRANERVEVAHAEIEKLQGKLQEAYQQLQRGAAPAPNPDNPLIDVQEPIVLDRLERVYELLEEVDIDNLNEDGTVTVPAAI